MSTLRDDEILTRGRADVSETRAEMDVDADDADDADTGDDADTTDSADTTDDADTTDADVGPEDATR
jgi:hypothetical protein